MRNATVERKTKETQIRASVNIDGTGKSIVETDIGFLTHMLETCAHHGLFDLEMQVKGDTHVDQHHTVEDTGIVLGEALNKALGEKRGITRTGFFVYPMDETLVMTAVDLSGRSYLVMDAVFANKRVGSFSTEVLEDFFQGFVTSLGAALHITLFYGRSDHHKIEAIFKALGKSLRHAWAIDERVQNQIPSIKGIL
jgi:imidazoleglycerol-phosphate dehydratase